MYISILVAITRPPIRIIYTITTTFIKLIIKYNIRLAITVMSVMSQSILMQLTY